ncbi:FG-nucleoporin nsp1 [Myotisia sp. PD_48]|nr:FG-nucleoporin nsp1 [Myotisia sp. PD_48]
MAGFQFGTPSSSGGASPFGQTTAGSGIFGNAGATQNATTSSSSPTLFGNPTASQTQGSGLFGTPATSSSGSPFNFAKPAQPQGQQNTTAPSPFGVPATPSQAAGQGKQMFGDAAKSSPAFGSTTPAAGTSGLFGNISTTPAGPPPQPSVPQFSFPGATQSNNGSSVFAKPNASSTTTPTAPAPSTQASNAFGAASNAGTSSLFANFGASKPQATQGLTSTSTTEAAKPEAPKSMFGSLGTTPAKPPSSALTFGTQPAASQAPKPAFSLTPTTAATESPKSSMFSLNTSTASTATPTTASGGQPSGLFSNLNAPKPTTATTQSSTPATTGQPTSSLFATPASTTPASTQAAKGSTLGGAPATTAPTTTATTAPTTGAPGTAKTNLGASTVGPAPPAQSRLKNKTMDEIITRWATDLTKYQKEFQEQAEQVAEWDRMLVENGTKVQKLYGNTVDAERATQEVERQLTSVESQQDELSSWLDRYEQEVETLLSKQVGVGDALQGPDQERERTYKLAERLSERLNDMGQDLTSMIEEVNSASATLSKTSKSDEPISQIVRILNSHLSQLQLIDQNTANLRAKIVASQKAGNSMGGYRNGTTGGIGGGNAADDFYRAYMGKR